MKLHSPSFEKAMRHRVRRAVRQSPELQREFKAAARFRKQYSLAVLIRPAISVGLGVVVWLIAKRTGHAETALAAITLWSFFLTLAHAQRLVTSLYADPDISALSLLPVTQSTIFRWEFQKFVRGSTMALVDLVIGYSALALYLEFSPLSWAGLFIVVALTWMTVVALATLGATYVPNFPYQLVSTVATVTLFGLFFARKFVGDAVIGILDRSAPGLNLVLPTGWPVSLFHFLRPNPEWIILVLLVPVGALVWTIRGSLARLQSNYEFGELIVAEGPDLIPGTDAEIEAAATAGESSQQVGLSAIEEIVRSRQFLVSPQWSQRAWFEGVLWKRLTSRERVLAEFIFPAGVAVTSPWKTIAKIVFVTFVMTLATGWLIPGIEFWVFGLGLFVAVCMVLAQILGSGKAFEAVSSSGINISLYAVYPVGYRELARLLLKCSAVQIPLLFSFVMVCSAMVAYLAKLPLAAALVFGAKLSVLMFAARFLTIAFSFSSGTNDTSAFRLRPIGLIVLAVTFSGLFLGLGAAALFVPNQLAAWSLCSLAILDAYAFFRLYGWFYNANRFDLMRFPTQ